MTGCIYLWHVYKHSDVSIFAIHEIKVHIRCSLVSTIQEIVFFPYPFLNQFLSAKHIKLKVLRYKLELMKCLIKHSKCRIVNIYCLSHFLVPFISSFQFKDALVNFFSISSICFHLFGLALRVHIKYFTIFVL